MAFHDLKKQKKIYNRRSFVLLTTKLSLASILGYKLFDIQILNSDKYKTLSKKNQIDIDILYPLRGEIFDANNILIATNKNINNSANSRNTCLKV